MASVYRLKKHRIKLRQMKSGYARKYPLTLEKIERGLTTRNRHTAG